MGWVKVKVKDLPAQGIYDFRDNAGNVYEVTTANVTDWNKRSAEGGTYYGVIKIHPDLHSEVCSVTRTFLIQRCTMRYREP